MVACMTASYLSAMESWPARRDSSGLKTYLTTYHMQSAETSTHSARTRSVFGSETRVDGTICMVGRGEKPAEDEVPQSRRGDGMRRAGEKTTFGVVARCGGGVRRIGVGNCRPLSAQGQLITQSATPKAPKRQEMQKYCRRGSFIFCQFLLVLKTHVEVKTRLTLALRLSRVLVRFSIYKLTILAGRVFASRFICASLGMRGMRGWARAVPIHVQ